MYSIDEARDLLTKAGVFFRPDDEEDSAQMLNMNDVWAWACADGEVVPDDELPRVAKLFYRYGYCGLLYWVSERNNCLRSEFHDINRFIDFVVMEEGIRAEVPDSSTRAYTKLEYMLSPDPTRMSTCQSPPMRLENDSRPASTD